MNKVITINLNGKAYQVEETGFDALRSYLEQAGKKLDANPDKAEIMADFEQAIADKCNNFLTLHKTVVTNSEVDQIIKEMGSVETSDDKDAPQGEKEKNETTPPKKLYQIREGAMLSGVCNGIAAYVNVDVTLIRVAFVLLTLLTHGLGILAYVIMAIILPDATTSQEKAAARGLPFNAQELLQRAKEKYKDFDETYLKSQKQQWKKWKHEHTQKVKAQKQKWEQSWYHANLTAHENRVKALGGFAIALLTLIMVIVSLGWIVAIISILTTGALFGIVFIGLPLWITIALLTAAYNILLLPLRQTLYGSHAHENGWFGILDAIMWLSFLGVIGWLIWTYIPQSHALWNEFLSWWQ